MGADELIFAPSLADAFRLVDLPFPGDSEPGRMVRFSTNGKNGDTAGWMKCYPEGNGAIFGCWRKGVTYCWQKQDGNAPPFSPAEREAIRHRAAETRKQAVAERDEAYAQAAKECGAVWESSPPAPATHPYLQRKGIAPYVARVDTAGRLVLPVFDAAGHLQSLQAIAPNGDKRFHPGGKMQGGRVVLGAAKDGSPIVVAEGFATGAGIHDAADVTVAVAFSGSNLAHVVESLRRDFPRSPLLVAGDMDAHKAGAEYARKAAEAGKPAQVVLPSFKDGRDTGDFNDLAGVEGPQEVRRQILNALRPSASAFPFSLASNLMNGPQVAPWLVRKWIGAGALAMLFGESTAGKSFVALDWSACIATGTPWNGCTVQPGAVFYICGEGKGGIGRRLVAWETYYGISLKAAPLFVSERGAALMDEVEAYAIGQAVRGLSERHGPPALVVVDTMHRNMGAGDENSAEDVGKFIANLDRYIRAALNCAVLVVHHSGHADKTRSRGSSAIRAALDAEFSLALDGGGLRKLGCTKQKDNEPPPAMALQARTVTLAEPWVDDEIGEPLTSLVLVPADSTANITRHTFPPKAGNQKIAWDAVGTALREAGDHRPTEAPAELPDGRPCITLEAAIERVRTKLVCDDKRRTERAQDAVKGLVARGSLVHVGGWVWVS